MELFLGHYVALYNASNSIGKLVHSKPPVIHYHLNCIQIMLNKFYAAKVDLISANLFISMLIGYELNSITQQA